MFSQNCSLTGLGEVRFAPSIPDPERSTAENLNLFFKDFLKFNSDVFSVLKSVSEEEKNTIMIFIAKNYGIWKEFLHVLPPEVRSGFDEKLNSVNAQRVF